MATGRFAPQLDFVLDKDFFSEFRLKEGPVIGTGGSGEVVLATSADDPKVQRAVKKFDLHGPDAVEDEDVLQDEATQRSFMKEVAIMKRLRHPNVMSIVAAVRTPRYLAIVMPYCYKGALSPLIPTLMLSQQRKLMKQITRAVEYLHRRNIVHGDIKPHNVIIDDNGNALLSDFGLSRAVPNQRVEIFVDFGTQAYRAPETLGEDRVNPFKADMYSLGVTMWAIVMRKRPLHWLSYLEELQVNLYVPGKYRRILSSLLDVDPSKRLTAPEVLEDL